MGLNILKWLIPIVMELFKSDGKYQSYFRRNRTITLLMIACVCCVIFNLFFFEQAVVHGTNAKLHSGTNAALVEKLSACEAAKINQPAPTCD